jgi:WD40 repeat protein
MLVVSLVSGDVLVLETDTLQTRRTFTQPARVQPSSMVYCAVVSLNGEVMVAKDTNTTFSSWDLLTGTRLQYFRTGLPESAECDNTSLLTFAERCSNGSLNFGELGPMALTDDGKQVATAHKSRVSRGNSVVVIWDVVSGLMTHAFENYVNLPLALAFSPTGSFLVCTDTGGECTEFCLTGAQFMTRNVHTGDDDASEMCAVAWEPGSDLYICGHHNGSVIAVESAGCSWTPSSVIIPDATSYFAYSHRGDSVAALAASSDGMLLAVAGGRVLEETDDPSDTGEYMCGFVAVYKSRIKTIDKRTDRQWEKGMLWKHWTEQGHKGSVLSVSFSLDCKLLASAGVDGFCRLWDSMDGTIVNQINLSHIVTDLWFVFDIEDQQKRRMALAMGGHKRLGAESGLSVFPDDLMDTLMSFV